MPLLQGEPPIILKLRIAVDGLVEVAHLEQPIPYLRVQNQGGRSLQ